MSTRRARMSGETPRSGNRRPHYELSPRERDVMELRARGFTYKGVAAELGITFHTVKNHIASARRRAGVG